MTPHFSKQSNSFHSESYGPPPYTDAQDNHENSNLVTMQSTQVADIPPPYTSLSMSYLRFPASRNTTQHMAFRMSFSLGWNYSTCVFSRSLTRSNASASFISATVSLLLSVFTACQQISRWHSQRGCSLHATASWHFRHPSQHSSVWILMNQMTFSLHAKTYKTPCVLEIGVSRRFSFS